MRHGRFSIGEAERDAWLRHMRTALDELALDPAHDEELWRYLGMAAHSLVTRAPEDGPPAPPDLADGPPAGSRRALPLSPPSAARAAAPPPPDAARPALADHP